MKFTGNGFFWNKTGRSWKVIVFYTDEAYNFLAASIYSNVQTWPLVGVLSVHAIG